MTKAVTAAFVLALSFALAGCFVSEKPLITPIASDHPLKNGQRFALSEWDEMTKTWESKGTGVIKRQGSYYVTINDDPNSDAGTYGEFLLRRARGNFFIASAKDGSSYHYDLVQIDGSTVYQYGLACENADKTFETQGLIETFEGDSYGATCTVDNFGKLTRIFLAIEKTRGQPKARFVLK